MEMSRVSRCLLDRRVAAAAQRSRRLVLVVDRQVLPMLFPILAVGDHSQKTLDAADTTVLATRPGSQRSYLSYCVMRLN